MDIIDEKNLKEFCQNVKNKDELKPNFPAYIIIAFRKKNPKMLAMIMKELKVKTSELDTIIKESINEKNLFMLNILLQNASRDELIKYSNFAEEGVKKFIQSKIEYSDEEKEKFLRFSKNPVIIKKIKIKMQEYYNNVVNFDDLSEKQKIQIVDKIIKEYEIELISF